MMQIGDKIVCISNNYTYFSGSLTIGKIYQIDSVNLHIICLVNDNLVTGYYYPEDFMLLSEYRNNLIIEICK